MCAFVSEFAYKPKKLKESKGGDGGGGGAPGKMKLEFASEPTSLGRGTRCCLSSGTTMSATSRTSLEPTRRS